MNYLGAITNEYKNNGSFLSQLPTLGPWQMVRDYICGGKPIKDAPQLSHVIGHDDSFNIYSKISLDRNGNLAVYNVAKTYIQIVQPNGTFLKPISCNCPGSDFKVGPDNNFYITDGDIHIYDRSGNKHTIFQVPDRQRCHRKYLAFADDGCFLLTQARSDPAELHFFDQTGQCLTRRNLNSSDNFAEDVPHAYIPAVAWDPSSNTFAVAEKKENCRYLSPSLVGIYKYNKDTKSLGFIRYINLIQPDCIISALSFDVTGNLVVAHEAAVDIYSRDGVHKNALPCKHANSVVVDAHGTIYVIDRGTRLSVWK